MSGVPQGSHERGVPQSMGALVREQGAASVHLQVGMLVLQRAELEQLSWCFLSYVSFVCALKLLALTSMTFGASSNGQSENNKIDHFHKWPHSLWNEAILLSGLEKKYSKTSFRFYTSK
jgi:hypothetical protein